MLLCIGLILAFASRTQPVARPAQPSLAGPNTPRTVLRGTDARCLGRVYAQYTRRTHVRRPTHVAAPRGGWRCRFPPALHPHTGASTAPSHVSAARPNSHSVRIAPHAVPRVLPRRRLPPFFFDARNGGSRVSAGADDDYRRGAVVVRRPTITQSADTPPVKPIRAAPAALGSARDNQHASPAFHHAVSVIAGVQGARRVYVQDNADCATAPRMRR